MTNEMEKEIVAVMERVEAEGGIVRGIAEGRVQADVNRQAYELEQRVQDGAFAKVGVNCFVEETEQEQDIEFHAYREKEAACQLERLKRTRHERDGDAVRECLRRVRDAATNEKNVMPAVIAAVSAYATVGEVCAVLREVLGTYKEPVRF